MKIVIVVMLVAVLAALAGAGLFMLRKGGHDPSRANPAMARALAIRVALSVAVFLFVLLAWRMGWIQPSGIPVSA